jgi:phosphate starvation-inducible protein PhoH and related proteins
MGTNTTKRVPKTEVKQNLTLSEDQKIAKSHILENKISLITGSAGTGKSLLASNIALSLFFSRQVDRIIITRPTVQAIDTNDFGILPGEIDMKLSPYTIPIMDSMKKLYNKQAIDKMESDGTLVMMPVQFMRGITIDNEILIVDEANNLTIPQLKLILTRIGKNSKIIFCGDYAQCDFKNNKLSGINKLQELCNKIEGMYHVELSTNHRDDLVTKILKEFDS